MIVKTTFKDNDYTSLLEEYWDKFLFCNSRCAIDKLEGQIRKMKTKKDVKLKMILYLIKFI